MNNPSKTALMLAGGPFEVGERVGEVRGALWGEGDFRCLPWGGSAWNIVEINEWDEVSPGVIKAPSGWVVARGDREDITQKLYFLGGRGAVIGITLKGGYKAVLTGGYKSTLIGGCYSTLLGGDQSHLVGQDFSQVNGGWYSHVEGGMRARLVAGGHSTLIGGSSSTLIGHLECTLIGGESSYLISGRGSVFQGGYKSSFHLVNSENQIVASALVGETFDTKRKIMRPKQPYVWSNGWVHLG